MTFDIEGLKEFDCASAIKGQMVIFAKYNHFGNRWTFSELAVKSVSAKKGMITLNDPSTPRFNKNGQDVGKYIYSQNKSVLLEHNPENLKVVQAYQKHQLLVSKTTALFKKLVANRSQELDDMPTEKLEQLYEFAVALDERKDNTSESDGGRVLGDDYRLCYIDDGVMYFTDDFENCWGDDWKAAPLQDNAGEPYIYDDNRSAKDNAEKGASRLVLIGFRSDWQTTYPWKNKNYSVEDVNKGAVAWIHHDETGGLFAGTPLSKAVGWIKRAGFLWGRLTT